MEIAATDPISETRLMKVVHQSGMGGMGTSDQIFGSMVHQVVALTALPVTLVK